MEGSRLVCLLLPALVACGADSAAGESIATGEQNAGAEEPASTEREGEGARGSDTIQASSNAHAVAESVPGHEALVEEAQRILRAVTTTGYSHTTTIDETSGTFLVDCSGFVDYALANVLPDAFLDLQNATVKRPVAKSFVSFTTGLGAGGIGRWRRVTDARTMVPGDVIAWLTPPDSGPTTNTGHVMIASSVGTTVVFAGAEEVQLDVIDASESGHGKIDPRTESGAKGLGSGRIALTIDAQGAPTGYRWSTETYSKPRPTTVTIAHLE
jgi:hypothetical protein